MDRAIRLTKEDIRAAIRKALVNEDTQMPVTPENSAVNKDQQVMDRWNRVKEAMERKNHGEFGRAYIKYLQEYNPGKYEDLVIKLGRNIEAVKQKLPFKQRFLTFGNFLDYLAKEDMRNTIFDIMDDPATNVGPLTTGDRILFLNYLSRIYRRQGLQPHELKGIDPGQVSKYSYSGMRSYKVNMSEEQVVRLVMEVVRRLTRLD